MRQRSASIDGFPPEDADGEREGAMLQARFLDLVPGRSKKAYAHWLTQRAQGFTAGVEVATLGLFHGCEAAFDEQLADASYVLDPFHVVALGTKCVDEVCRRVRQATTGHRCRKGDRMLFRSTIGPDW